MPLYEYKCQACGHLFEVIQKFSDAPIASCPKCGSPVQKLLSSPAIQFKGSGWYITDYARKNGGAEASAKGEKSEKNEKSEKSTTDSSSSSTDAASKSSTTESSGSSSSTSSSSSNS
jgi:putative FmdB family regulatory protein